MLRVSVLLEDLDLNSIFLYLIGATSRLTSSHLWIVSRFVKIFSRCGIQ